MRKTNTKITIFLLFFLIAGQFSASLAYASEITSDNVIRLVNEERAKKNIPLLVENVKLSKIAENKAKDMLERDYFAHTSPDGITPWFWFEKEGYDYEFAGENLAINFTSAEKQNESWMNSQTHRKNILSSNFNEIGVAVVKGVVDGKEAVVTVQEFGSVSAGSIAGDASSKNKEGQVQVDFETEKIQEKSFFAGIISNIGSVQYLKVMKGTVAVSVAVIAILVFTSFAHRLSKIGEALEGIGRKIFKEDFDLKEVHDNNHRIAIKFFPIDMVKIRVNHLHHMKQRE